MTAKILDTHEIKTALRGEAFNPEVYIRLGIVAQTLVDVYRWTRDGRYIIKEDEMGYAACGMNLLPRHCNIEVPSPGVSLILEKLAPHHMGIKETFLNKEYGKR